jgi:hypothetical protein
MAGVEEAADAEADKAVGRAKDGAAGVPRSGEANALRAWSSQSSKV